MKLLNKRKNTAAATPEPSLPAKITAANWTRGQQLAATGARVLLWALVACAPLALGIGALALNASARPATVTAEPVPTEPPGRSQAAGIAEHAVTTWLSASRGSEPQLEGLTPNVDLPAKGLQVSDPGVVETVWDNSSWVVTVAVTVTTTLPAPDDATTPETTTQRRYFQLPVAVDPDGEVSVLSLPAEVAGPQLMPAARPAYRAQLPATHPIAAAAGEFLTALLAGGGDITRYVAPDAQIRAVSPAPYASVVVESATAADAPPENPAEGEAVELLVRARAQDAADATTRFDYVLSLALRSGRWEVTQINGAPTRSRGEVPAPVPDVSSPVPTTNP